MLFSIDNNCSSVPVSTTAGVCVAVALLFSTVGFTGGVVTGVFGSKRKRTKASVDFPMSALSVAPPITETSSPNTAPEYEEINTRRDTIKQADIPLMHNDAYGADTIKQADIHLMHNDAYGAAGIKK